MWAPLAFDTHRDQLAIHGIDLENALVSHNVAQTAGFVTAGLGVALVSSSWFANAAGLTWRALSGVVLVTSHHLVTRNAKRLPRPARTVHTAAQAVALGR